MNNFTSIMEKSDLWEIMVDDVTNYLDKVNKKMLPLNVRDAIYFTKKSLFCQEGFRICYIITYKC